MPFQQELLNATFSRQKYLLFSVYILSHVLKSIVYSSLLTLSRGENANRKLVTVFRLYQILRYLATAYQITLSIADL
jgi:hypothetical protein